MTKWFAAALAAAVAGCAEAPADLHAGKAAADLAKAGAGSECAGGCGGNAPSGNGAQATQAVKVPIDGSPAQGSADAPLTLVAFTDYECPFCSRAEATVEKLAAEYGGKLRLVVKHNPLPMHPRALPAARAAIAAQQQGKFWEMHAQLFAAGRSLDDAGLDAAATRAGLDLGRFHAALNDGSADAIIQRDQKLAQKIGANGTPTFFLNGRKLQGAQPIEKFRALAEDELARSVEPVLRNGTRPGDVYAKLQETAAESAAPEAAPSRPPPVAPANERAQVDVGASAIRGDSHAPVTLVVFSDFQCPFCQRGASTLKALDERYAGKLKIAFRNLPLPMHPNARIAAAAGVAANEQGKFWEMHDALFAHPDELDRAGLQKRAGELGLDVGRFTSALERGADAVLAADEADAQKLGVTGTPTFFVNGRKIVGAQPVEVIAAVIDEELGRR